MVLLRKMTCGLRHPMTLRHPVPALKQQSYISGLFPFIAGLIYRDSGLFSYVTGLFWRQNSTCADSTAVSCRSLFVYYRSILQKNKALSLILGLFLSLLDTRLVPVLIPQPYVAGLFFVYDRSLLQRFMAHFIHCRSLCLCCRCRFLHCRSLFKSFMARFMYCP